VEDNQNWSATEREKATMKTFNIVATKDNVENFNKYFSNVAEKINKRIKENDIRDITNRTGYMTYMTEAFKSPFPTITITKTTNKEIEKIIGSLKSSYTHGYDEISDNILKTSKNFIGVPLCYLCNKMLFEGGFPEGLKYGEIVPVYKKGKNNTIVNYRTISILTSLNKILRRLCTADF
jgi:hypothetical protein